MCVHNGMPFLPEAVNSIINQTLSSFYFVIIDDGSTDGTWDFLTTLSDSRISKFHTQRIGIANALNLGLSKCNTEYAAIMDADDISCSRRLELQEKFLDNNSSVGLVGCSVKYFTNNLRSTWINHQPSSHITIMEGLRNRANVITHSTIMFRRKLIDKIGVYKSSAEPVPDLEFFLRCSLESQLANIPELFCFVRLHSWSYTYKYFYEIIKKRNVILRSFPTQGYLQKEYSNNHSFSLISLLNYYSQLMYRNGIIFSLDGKKLPSLFYFGAAAFFDPLKVFYYLNKKLKNISSSEDAS